MKNQVFTGTPTSRRFALCPTTIKAGDPVLLGGTGGEPAFALDDYQSGLGGTTFLLNGTFQATVVGSTSHSPYTPAAIKQGSPLYASGTYDATTNVTYDLFISATNTDSRFGNLDPSYVAVGSGLTDTAAEVQI